MGSSSQSLHHTHSHSHSNHDPNTSKLHIATAASTSELELATTHSALERSPSLAEHTYSETFKKSELTLKIHARSRGVAKEGSKAHLPCLFKGDPVSGTVALDVRESSFIKSVSVSVRICLCPAGNLLRCVLHFLQIVGEMIFEDVTCTFVEVTEHLWNHHTGFADVATQPHELTGQHYWPFTLKLPENVVLNHGSPGTYPLPESFSTRRTRTVIQYRVFATLVHGLLSAEYT